MHAVAVADYLSLTRIPLGLVFLFVAGQRLLAMLVLALAAISDVLDGWVARRERAAAIAEPHTGDWLDPLCDKIFALAVVIGLLRAQHPPVGLVGLLLVREVLQVIAVTLMRFVPALHRVARDYNFRAHPIGKATTVAQFAAAGALVLNHPAAWPLASACALLGIASVAIYVHRIRGLLARPEPRRA
jgi:cardiolipin synthase (CMP-forming)